MVDGSGPVFGKRGQSLVPSDAVWDYDERNRRVANAAFDAELVLGQAALIDDPEHPPPVEVRCRVGDLVAAFSIDRLPSRTFVGPREEPIDKTWWRVDYRAMRLRVGVRSGLVSSPDLDPTSWERFDDGLRRGLYRFLCMRPKSVASNLIHCIGGRMSGVWYPQMFRSFGSSGWFRHTKYLPRKLNEFEAMHRALPVLPSSDWRFETQPSPQIVYLPTGDRVRHEPGSFENIFYLVYDGTFGTFRFKVIARELWAWGSQPREWNVETGKPMELRYGSSRDREHPGTPGEARLSEADWHRLDSFLTEALLRWPACEMTGLHPVWLQFSGGYEEGAWRSWILRVIGLNTDMTGLSD